LLNAQNNDPLPSFLIYIYIYKLLAVITVFLQTYNR
jgi:hypothetical protein